MHGHLCMCRKVERTDSCFKYGRQMTDCLLRWTSHFTKDSIWKRNVFRPVIVYSIRYIVCWAQYHKIMFTPDNLQSVRLLFVSLQKGNKVPLVECDEFPKVYIVQGECSLMSHRVWHSDCKQHWWPWLLFCCQSFCITNTFTILHWIWTVDVMVNFFQHPLSHRMASFVEMLI